MKRLESMKVDGWIFLRTSVFERTGDIKLGEKDQETEWEIYRSTPGKGREPNRSESIFSGGDSGGYAEMEVQGRSVPIRIPR